MTYYDHNIAAPQAIPASATHCTLVRGRIVAVAHYNAALTAGRVATLASAMAAL